MPASKKKQHAQNAWIAKTYDRITVNVRKGQRAVIQAYAAAHGESVNGFISRAMREAMERDPLPEQPAKEEPEG